MMPWLEVVAVPISSVRMPVMTTVSGTSWAWITGAGCAGAAGMACCAAAGPMTRPMHAVEDKKSARRSQASGWKRKSFPVADSERQPLIRGRSGVPSDGLARMPRDGIDAHQRQSNLCEPEHPCAVFRRVLNLGLGVVPPEPISVVAETP